MNHIDNLRPEFIPGLVPISNSLVCFNYGSLEPFWDQLDLVVQAWPHRKFVVFAHNDPYDLDSIKSKVIKHDFHKMGYVLVNDIEFARANADLGFRFFSFVWHWYYSYFKRHPNISSNLIRSLSVMPDHRPWKISCLNKSVSYSRLLTFWQMNLRPWYNDAYVTFNADWNSINNYQNEKLPPKLKKWLSKHQQLFPFNFKETISREINCWQIDIEPYAGSYLNLVTETQCKSRLVTEKSAKAIAAGCLPQFVATENFVGLLSAMGFDMNFQGLDHGYDQLPTYDQRISYIMRQLDRVWPDIPDIWHANRRTLQQNREWLLSNEFENFLLQDVRDILTYDQF